MVKQNKIVSVQYLRGLAALGVKDGDIRTCAKSRKMQQFEAELQLSALDDGGDLGTKKADEASIIKG